MIIKEKIQEQIPRWMERIQRLKKEYSNFVVGEVTIEQILSGIRGVQISISDISYVDPYEGIRLRGYTISQVLSLLPKAKNSRMPLAGGLYHLLLTGELPSQKEAEEVEEIWRCRSEVPQYVWDVICSMPPETHPMTLFSQAIMALQPQSLFARAYLEGVQKSQYWEYYLEDSLNLTAKIPQIAAFIYCWKYKDGKVEPPDPNLDWSASFAQMIGKGSDWEYQELMRLYLVIHSDHEGANVSAHTSHLVSSALSDIYLSSAAGMNGLAGPLHGLANQECIRWLLNVYDHFQRLPSDEELEGYIRNQLSAGYVIPGYGHAVLRVTDPRFTAQMEFAEQFLPQDPLFQLVKQVYRLAPSILGENGKIKNPRPNVDAINGCLQYYYGVREVDFYTVLFGVSRLLGLTAHAIWARALGKPIERPKSLTTQMLEERVGII
ncbi:citrate synthase [Bellilinea caldifistulae]|uniref:citrate synthase (unknown stereospecificity) n=1 Tax=Bellilinea caldifistulae TaxID=360411 RepID=A0A0P6XCT3_9CHLR|nr:citrate (Si)-synthase [Bellilinea caldifistulae]KPL78056.1 type I citrate synthase [Bellilinea caldifistulae]GAP10744.1 citrate synthase [Bellilinea caldifistulae]